MCTVTVFDVLIRIKRALEEGENQESGMLCKKVGCAKKCTSLQKRTRQQVRFQLLLLALAGFQNCATSVETKKILVMKMALFFKDVYSI